MVTISSLDQEGRGIAHDNGKVIFIEGALPGEEVEYSSFRKKPSFEFAQVTRIKKPSFSRVAPRCEYFGICGGCSMQHLDEGAQVAMKQRILEDNFKHIAKVKPEVILPAIYGPAWGYRQRARFSARYVVKKQSLLIGFHEKRSSFVADMHACHIVPKKISELLPPLREMVARFSIRDRIPQVELAYGDSVHVLVLRIMEPLSASDEGLIREFAERHNVQIYLQPKGPDSAYPFYPQAAPLTYSLPEFNVIMPFHPTEFTQVNQAVNRVLVRRAISLIDPQPNDVIADLFCGLGNFTLALAQRAKSVVGIDGSEALIKRAGENAAFNGINNVTFAKQDLFKVTQQTLQEIGSVNKMLIDPPRDGAAAVVKALESDDLQRIVYVSCNPATLARDAAILVHTKGFCLRAAGVVNMFPHTSHVESIAVFDR